MFHFSKLANGLPYLTSGTVIDDSAMFVAKIIFRVFLFDVRIANSVSNGSAVECITMRKIFVS